MSEETSVAEEVKEEPQAAPETTGAQEEDLDSLLKEFEGVEEKTEQTATEETDRVARLEKELQELRERDARKAVESELSSIGAKIRGDLPSEVFDDDMMRAYLESRAAKDPRLAKAFMNREQTPSQWNKIVDGLARDFQERGSKLPDKQVTEDMEAVANAVRSASTRTSEEPETKSLAEVQRMNDDEAAKWRKEQAKKLGY